MSRLFERFFPPSEESVAVADASQILEWTRPIYFQTFMAYIDRGCDEAIKVRRGDEMMYEQVRQNTFKEIREHIRKQIAAAQRILSEASGE